MKTSMLIALMTEGFSLLGVRFRREGGGQSSKMYHYKYPGFDVEVGDMVVVESPHNGFVIVDVEEVDNDPVLDTNAGFSYKWVVQKVDTTEYYKHKERELALTKHLRRLQNKAEAERTLATIREELRDTEAGKEFEALVADLDVGAKKQVSAPPVQPQVEKYDKYLGVEVVFQLVNGKWSFRKFGCSYTHSGFPDLDTARKVARSMIETGVIK